MAFTASTSLIVQKQLEMMFTRPTANEAEFNHEVMTAKVLLEKQSVETDTLMEGNRCVGVKAWFIQDGQTSITYSGSVPNPSEDCTTPAGVELSTNSKTFNNNLFIEASRAVKAEKCDNDLTFAVESAKAIQKAMLDVRKDLNKKYIQLLAANVQANQYTNVSSIITAQSGNRLKVAPSNFTLELLLELGLLANNNKIFDPVFINGRNFFIDSELARYRTLTTDQNDEARIVNDFDIHWDTKNPGFSVDSVTTRLSTFIVNPNQLVFWNTTWSDYEPKLEDPKNNRWTYLMDDPELVWNDNGVLRPVTYEVEYSYVCDSRLKGRLIWNHTYFVRLYGGLDVGPTGKNDAGSSVYTGIMEIVAEA